MRSGSALSIDNMSTIRDANIAVSAQKGAFVKALNTKFLNNNFAVTTAPSGTGSYNITLLSNQYGTTVGGLKPAYSGQSPAPLEKGFAGVYVNDITNGLVIDSDPSSGEPNHFFNLKYGIISKNTNMTVFDSRFDDITKVTKGTGYDGYVNAFVQTGKGVYASEGYILVAKEGTKDVIFSNCHTGVETLGSSSQVGSTTMDGVTNGIITTGGTALLLSNTIKAKSRGISTLLSSGPGSGSVGGNIITMNEDPNGIGISIGGGVSGNTNIGTSPPSDDYYTFNTITMLDGAAAISAGVNDNGTFANNTINLNNSQANRFGIHIEGGDRNTLKCNAITGVAGDNTGIYAIHASRALVHCNLTESTDEGLRFEGVLVGKAKADIAGNTMKDNGTGLLYGIDAITGSQVHRGNTWEGSFSNLGAQGGSNAPDASKYIVDEIENSDFSPYTWFPLAWFEDDNETSASYQCSNENGNCITAPPVIYEQPLDIKIVRNELIGDEYQAAVNWLAQRRFYERILEEGNPYPGNSDVAAFVTAAQSNGIAAYANLQTGIRQLFAVSTTNRNTFQSYEQDISEGLGDLAAVEQQLNAPGISQQDSAGFAAQRDTIRQTIQQAASAKETLLNNIVTARTSAAASLLTQNSNLPALTPVYTVHEKTVNDILLRTVAQGTYAFAEGDYNTLRTIANLCPLSDGEAVLRARALLTLVNENPVTYDDETICSTERGRPGLTTKSDHIRIYPNPATNQVTIEYNITNSSDNLFLLFNTLGQIVKTIVLPDNEGNIQLSLVGLSEGTYWYILPGLNGIASGNVIISR